MTSIFLYEDQEVLLGCLVREFEGELWSAWLSGQDLLDGPDDFDEVGQPDVAICWWVYGWVIPCGLGDPGN
jgi:hypothetical protein